MSAMTIRCSWLSLIAAACAGASPRPDSLRVEDLALREVSGEEAKQRDAKVALAVAALVQRRYDEAESLAQDILTIDPATARAHAILAMVSLQRAVVEDPPNLFLANGSEARMRLAEQLDGDDPFIGWLHAITLADQGHTSAAAAVAERALERAAAAPPAERAALLGAAGTYRYELGEERAALPHLQTYVGLRPDDATAQFRLGVSLLRVAELPQGIAPTSLLVAQRQAEGAASAFARCVELAPGDQDAALAVGAARLRAAALAEQRGDAPTNARLVAEAEQQFRAVAEKFPRSAEAHFRLGVVAEARGDAGAARAAYVRAVALDQRHVGSLLNLASLLDAAGERDQAMHLIGRILVIDDAEPCLTARERQRVAARRQRG